MTIADLTCRTGTSKRVVEHAEATGLLRPAARTPLGHKLYTAAEERQLRLIVRLYALGFKAKRIRLLFNSPPERLETLLDEHYQWLHQQAQQTKRQFEAYQRERPALRSELAGPTYQALVSIAPSSSIGLAAPLPDEEGLTTDRAA
jgi:DNA-binding transcriptional MerR regulator